MPIIRCPKCDRPVQAGADCDRVRCGACQHEIVLNQGEHDRVESGPAKGAGNARSRRRRTYVHDRCGGATIVSGDEFGRVANPFTFVSQTYCSACSSFDSLSSFSWADTGENIGGYRQRQRDKAPLSLSCGVWLVGPLLAAAPPALIAYFCAPTLRLVAALAGAIGGAVFFVAFLVPYATQWLWGIDYRREE